MKRLFYLLTGLTALLLVAVACDNELNIQQAYAFRLETMPVQARIVRGETAEIRCTLVREGKYDGARYTIRYFQPDGKGELRMDDGTLFLPNDRYPPHEGGVSTLLRLRVVGSADHRHLRRRQLRAMRTTDFRIPKRT